MSTDAFMCIRRGSRSSSSTYPESTTDVLWSVSRRSLILHRTCLKLISPQRAPSPHAFVWNILMNTSATGTWIAAKGPISVLGLFSGKTKKQTKAMKNNENPLDCRQRVVMVDACPQFVYSNQSISSLHHWNSEERHSSATLK